MSKGVDQNSDMMGGDTGLSACREESRVREESQRLDRQLARLGKERLERRLEQSGSDCVSRGERLLAMTGCSRARGAHVPLRSGLGREGEEVGDWTAFLRVQLYIFLSQSDLLDPRLRTRPYIIHNAQGRKAHLKAHFNASAQQHSEKVC